MTEKQHQRPQYPYGTPLLTFMHAELLAACLLILQEEPAALLLRVVKVKAGEDGMAGHQHQVVQVGSWEAALALAQRATGQPSTAAAASECAAPAVLLRFAAACWCDAGAAAARGRYPGDGIPSLRAFAWEGELCRLSLLAGLDPEALSMLAHLIAQDANAHAEYKCWQPPCPPPLLLHIAEPPCSQQGRVAWRVSWGGELKAGQHDQR